MIKLRVLPFLGGFTAGCVLFLAGVGLLGWTIFDAFSDLPSDVEGRPPTQRFDSTLWLEQEETEYDPDWPPRLLMVDSLLGSKRLDGLVYDEVMALLGPPFGSPTLGLNGEYSITYYLGDERSYVRVDSEWLEIEFSAEDQVKRAWLWRD